MSGCTILGKCAICDYYCDISQYLSDLEDIEKCKDLDKTGAKSILRTEVELNRSNLELNMSKQGLNYGSTCLS